MLALRPDEVHVWYATADALDAPDRRAAGEAMLNADERTAMARLMFPYLRREYLLTRVLCRTVLSQYATVPPASWEFSRNAHGRPEIFAPRLPTGLRFNLSNTRGMAACLVTAVADAGIDVEYQNRRSEPAALAEAVLSAPEKAAFWAAPKSLQRDLFFKLWTLKEAYIKARGLGMSLPVQSISFAFSDAGHIAASFLPPIDDAASHWQFAHLQLPDDAYVMSVAIRRQDGADLHITMVPKLPLSVP